MSNYRCEQHDPDSEDLAPMGRTTSGNPVHLNRRWVEAEESLMRGPAEKCQAVACGGSVTFSRNLSSRIEALLIFAEQIANSIPCFVR